MRVRFHPTVIKVGNSAFLNRRKLKEVVLNEGLVNIGKDAFAGSDSLESMTIPSNVDEIDLAAFYMCRSLKKVVLNEGLKKIRGQAFISCESLESITIPSTVANIEEGAFYECSNLKKVVLNEGLEKIDEYAFYGCSSLESITIPSSVAEIGSYVFNQCSNLKEVVCIEGLPRVESTAFCGCPLLERITFPNLSFRLDDIIRAGQVDVQNKIQQCINRSEMIEWERGGTIYIPMDVEVTRNNDIWKELKQRVDQIVKWIKYYEMKEATTIFELALWKAKMDQVEDGEFRTRDECRVDVPGPVKDAIMQYL